MAREVAWWRQLSHYAERTRPHVLTSVRWVTQRGRSTAGGNGLTAPASESTSTSAAGVTDDGLWTVVYRPDQNDPDQDEIFDFDDGQHRTFGRADTNDIVIWPAMTGRELSRIAGELWRADGTMWLRNLSSGHDLRITAPGFQEVLPPRGPSAPRGAAMSLPAPVALIDAPGDCRLEVRQDWTLDEQRETSADDDGTLSAVPEVPADLRVIATALCEPLLTGAQLPAAYQEVMARLGLDSLRVLRKDVDRLASVYETSSPLLARRAAERRRRQEEAQQPLPEPERRGVVQRWSAGQLGERTTAAPARPQPTGLALPDYVEVALLLVRHRRITELDLTLLPDRPGRTSP